jgi:hypothetical protein
MLSLDDYRRFYAEEVQLAARLTSPALIEALGQPGTLAHYINALDLAPLIASAATAK